MYYLTHKKEMLGFSLFKGYPNIFQFTTSRQGGFSQGSYGSLNGSYYSGDQKELVDQNWALLQSYFPRQAKQIIAPYQNHEDQIVCIDKDFLALPPALQKKKLFGVDALISQEADVLLTVATADCVPISLYDPIKEVIAVVHAGWRGTVLSILAKTVQQLCQVYGCQPSNILAGIGPSISVDAFEVGDEVVEAFEQAQFDLKEIAYRPARSEKYHIDLWKANEIQLLECGVLSQHIACAQICTFKRYKEFFSARRLGVNSGRIITGIQIKGENKA